MADQINFVNDITRITGPKSADLREAIDISDYDELDVLLGVVNFTATNVTFSLETSMQNESEQGWVSAGSFTIVSATSAYENVNFKNLLRYVRWTATWAGSGACDFYLKGMARRWS